MGPDVAPSRWTDQTGGRGHVFVSYGHADQNWVRTLAENLYRVGLDAFYDEWEIAPGDVLVHRLYEGIEAPPTESWW